MIRMKKLDLRGYRSIASASIDMGSLDLLIGANGAGKSNLLSFFRLLNEAVDGNLQLFVQRQGGAGKLLHFGPKHTEQIEAELVFETEKGVNRYRARLVPGSGGRLLFIEEEIVYHQAGAERPFTERWTSAAEESQLAVARGPWANNFFRKALSGFRIYHFHDTAASARIKQPCSIHDHGTLRHDGANLAAFLHMLREHHHPYYQRIRRAIQQVAPFFDDFLLEPLPGNQSALLLEWRERGADEYFNADDLSDGTLRFICLATLLLQPSPPSAIIIDEPELGLHPAAIGLLAALLQACAQTSQILIATQSVTLLSALGRPEQVIVVDRSRHEARGASSFRRLDPAELTSWLEDYSLGDLWSKNLLGGRP